MKRMLAGGFILFALVASCRDPLTATLRIGLLDSPETLDPHRRNTLAASNVTGQMYESLVTTDANMHLGSGLAESWENPSENVWRFHLRKNVKFHTGKTLDAFDVQASFLRTMRDTSLELSSFTSNISAVRAISPATIEITTSRLTLPTLYRLLNIGVIPVDYTDYQDSWEKKSIGTGPYRLVQADANRVVLLERFPSYWGRKPHYERVELNFFPNVEELIEALSQRKLDLAKLDGATLPQKVKDFYEVKSTQSLYVVYLGFNLKKPGRLFTKKEERQKVNDAIDRQKLVQQSKQNFASATVQMISPFVYGFNPKIRLPAAAATPPAFPPHEEQLFLVRQIFADSGEALQKQFLSWGLNTKLQILPDHIFFERLRSGQFDLFLSRWGCDTADASELLEDVFFTKGYKNNYGLLNYTGFGNATIDAEIEESGLMTDPDQRLKKLQDLILTISEERPWAPLYINHDVYAVARNAVWEPRLDSRIYAKEFLPRR